MVVVGALAATTRWERLGEWRVRHWQSRTLILTVGCLFVAELRASLELSSENREGEA